MFFTIEAAHRSGIKLLAAHKNTCITQIPGIDYNTVSIKDLHLIYIQHTHADAYTHAGTHTNINTHTHAHTQVYAVYSTKHK